MKTSVVNWTEIRRHIESVRISIECGAEPSPEIRKGILKERSRELASVPQTGPEAGQKLDIVEFTMAEERYGFELRSVREVCLWKEVTPVPCTPDFVVGIINLRGEIRTVIDLKKLFELPVADESSFQKIMILHAGEMQLGIVVDGISGVHAIRVEELQQSLPTLTGIRADYLRGITRDRLVLLDADKILSDKRINVYEEVSI